ncbi:unnamed protein product, partial [Closterium sp. NIES-53]
CASSGRECRARSAAGGVCACRCGDPTTERHPSVADASSVVDCCGPAAILRGDDRADPHTPV